MGINSLPRSLLPEMPINRVGFNGLKFTLSYALHCLGDTTFLCRTVGMKHRDNVHRRSNSESLISEVGKETHMNHSESP